MPGTKIELGTMYRDVLTNQIMVHDGTEWKAMSQVIDDVNEFDTKSSKLHEENPTLKHAWEEYKSLRRLITGE